MTHVPTLTYLSLARSVETTLFAPHITSLTGDVCRLPYVPPDSPIGTHARKPERLNLRISDVFLGDFKKISSCSGQAYGKIGLSAKSRRKLGRKARMYDQKLPI